ncbi:MAG: FKBP-type peptidyl-prolyl cis-trans isomerase [Gammaproteobacteria bacterium]|nr:FKBP-type peptidyl-prolyl cis-trans isomerase [Gammaproteobacteria bacterium]
MKHQGKWRRIPVRRYLPVIPALLALVTSPASSGAEAPAFANKDQKMLYHWGTALADELANVGARDPEELRWIYRGMSDRVAGKSPPFTAEELTGLTNYLLDRIEKNGVAEQAQSVVFLREKAREPNAVVTKSGLIYREIVKGKGAQAARNSKVKVAYVGRLRNGWVFDSSRQRGGPLETPLTGVIACWQEAIPMMKVGGKASITCPPGLAYADAGTNTIPPGSALVFEVELLAAGK